MGFVQFQSLLRLLSLAYLRFLISNLAHWVSFMGALRTDDPQLRQCKEYALHVLGNLDDWWNFDNFGNPKLITGLGKSQGVKYSVDVVTTFFFTVSLPIEFLFLFTSPLSWLFFLIFFFITYQIPLHDLFILPATIFNVLASNIIRPRLKIIVFLY